MDKKKLLPLILSMSLPPALSMLIQSLYSIIDSMFVTAWNPLGMDAISIVYPIQNIILAIGVGLGVGVNATISIRLGEKNQVRAQNAATSGLLISIFNYLIIVAIFVPIAKPFIMHFTENDEIIGYAYTYIIMLILTSFNVTVQICFEKILQADGKMMLPMISLVTGAVVNIALDALFILILNYGIVGAALATIIGQSAASVVMLYFILSKKNNVRICLKDFKMDTKNLEIILKVGIPAIIMNGIPAVMTYGMNMVLKNYDNAIRTFGIYYKLQYFVYMGVSGVTQGSMPILSYSFGAQNKERMFKCTRYIIFISLIIGVVAAIIFMSIPNYLLSMFYHTGEYEELINAMAKCMRIAAISFPFGCVSCILCTYFQAVNHSVLSLIVSLLRQVVFLIPMASIMCYYKEELGAYIALPIAEFITLILSFIMYKVSKKIIHRKLDLQKI